MKVILRNEVDKIYILSLFLSILCLIYVTPVCGHTINPRMYGLDDAHSGVERYYILQKCHQIAIESGLPVSYQGIKEIDIEIPPNAKSIPLTGTTDFSNTKIIVHNKEKDIYLFILTSKLTSTTILTNTTRAGDSFNKEDFYSKHILMVVRDKEPWVAIRKGYSNGASRADVLLMYDGVLLNSPVAPYNSVTSNPQYSYCEYDLKQKTFGNIRFERSPESTAITNLVRVENQVDILLHDISISTPQNSNLYGDHAISVINSAHLILDRIEINGTYSQKDKYGYGVSLDNVYDLQVRRMQSNAKWGIFGTNNVNGAILKDCDINRFDIHCYGRDVRCYNCNFIDLYNQFSSIYGEVYFEKCSFSNFTPALMESSYNAYTPFDLTFKHCTFNLDGKNNCILSLVSLEEEHNSRPELSRKALPNITIKNCTVNLADDVKDWYLVNTGKVTYKESLDYISKIEVNRLLINGNLDFKLFSTDLTTTNTLKVVRKRVKMNSK